MQILKIHANEERIAIEYQKIFTQGDQVKTDEYSLKCHESARPEFYTALQSLRDDVIDICELPESYVDGMRILGVSFTHDEEIWGAVISASRTLLRSKSPLNIHTPYKPAVTNSGDQNRVNCLSLDCVSRLELVMELAEKYIDGDRNQINLFEEKRASGKAKAEKFSKN